MKTEQVQIKGLLVITPDIFEDERGYFYESFQQERYMSIGLPPLVQDNVSCSKKHVLRGLHYQAQPHAQGKLVSVLRGAILDVAVDIRSGSSTYGRHFMVELSSDNKKQLWLPQGFAHGFLALEDDTLVVYKCSEYYHPESEQTILWNDPELAIDWMTAEPKLSEKDTKGLLLSQIVSL